MIMGHDKKKLAVMIVKSGGKKKSEESAPGMSPYEKEMDMNKPEKDASSAMEDAAERCMEAVEKKDAKKLMYCLKEMMYMCMHEYMQDEPEEDDSDDMDMSLKT